jgi:hypothetical protein
MKNVSNIDKMPYRNPIPHLEVIEEERFQFILYHFPVLLSAFFDDCFTSTKETATKKKRNYIMYTLQIEEEYAILHNNRTNS